MSLDYTYTINPTRNEVEDFVAKIRRLGFVALDIETNGLDPYQNDILMVQVCSVDRHVLIFRHGLPRPLVKAFEEVEVIGHNLKFDIGFLMQKVGARFIKVWDTLLAENVLNLGLELPANLEDVARRRLQVTLKKHVRNSFIGRPKNAYITEEEFDYAARDTAILIELRDRQRIEVKQRKLDRVVDLENRACPATAWVELGGIKLDTSKWEQLVESLEPEYLKVLERLYHIHPYRKPLHVGLFADNNAVAKAYVDAMNLNSPKQNLKMFRELGYSIDSTNKNDLRSIAPHSKLAALLLEVRKVEKSFTSFLRPMTGYINPVTGRIHASYWQLSSRMEGGSGGTDSGRYSCNNPNLQQMPRDQAYRACFVPEGGYKFVSYDFSSQEVRIAGQLSREPVLIDFFNNPELDDYHRYTASVVWQVPYDQVTKELRFKAKAVNFGLLYGITAIGLSWQLIDLASLTSEGIEADNWSEVIDSRYTAQLSESENIIEAYYKNMPVLMGTLNRWAKAAIRNRYATDYTLGRIRQFNPQMRDGRIGRISKNHPIQGTAANICKEALIKLYNRLFLQNYDARVILMVHDELLSECREDIADEVAYIMQECMLEACNEICPGPIPHAVDGGISDYWKK